VTTDIDVPRLGEGIYTFAEAARIIRNAVDPISSDTLRRWVKTDLVPADRHDPISGDDALTFDDLVSLEVVRRLRHQDVHVGHRRKRTSLQCIRRVEATLREEHGIHRPFARKLFYTDGASVWAEVVGPDGSKHMVELEGKRPNHVVWRQAIATFAEQIEWGDEGRALAWRPTPWVEINPDVQYGAPVVAGTRVPVATIEAQLKGGTPSQVADWYDLEVRQVEGIREFLAVRS
jgi:uncharacterized protein (DUF433 family)